MPSPGSLSRRRVLQGGVAALAAGAAATMVGASEADAATPLHPDAGQEALMASVRDLRSGTIDIFVGTRHVTIHDRELAVRLANAAR